MKLPELPGFHSILDYIGAFLEILLNLLSPKTKNNPTLFFENSIDLRITLHVALYLRYPEFLARLDIILAMLPIVTMPEFTVAKHCNLLSDEGYIRLSRNSFDILPVMKPA